MEPNFAILFVPYSMAKLGSIRSCVPHFKLGLWCNDGNLVIIMRQIECAGSLGCIPTRSRTNYAYVVRERIMLPKARTDLKFRSCGCTSACQECQILSVQCSIDIPAGSPVRAAGSW